jgi:magnesium transporter
MEKRYDIENGKIVPSDKETAPIVVYVQPDEKEKRYLVNDLRLDEHTLNSALDPDELSRLEFEPEHTALIFKRPKSYSAADQFLFRVASMGAFLFKGRIVVVIAEDIPLFDHKQFQRVGSVREMALKLIFRCIFHFFEHLKVVNQISDDLEQKINRAMENRQLINLFTLEKSLVYYLNAINANGVLIEKLKVNALKIGFTTEEAELLDDIIVENTQCYRQAEIYSNILASLMDARVSIVSNNLNVLMKTLNIITIAIMVPTLVVSAFSMNVHIPFQVHPHAFTIIMSFALASVLLFLAIWRYRRW